MQNFHNFFINIKKIIIPFLLCLSVVSCGGNESNDNTFKENEGVSSSQSFENNNHDENKEFFVFMLWSIFSGDEF